MNRENGVLKWALTVSAILFLSGCVASGGSSQSSGDARKVDASASTKLQPGVYKIQRFKGKSPSHKGSYLAVSKFDGGKYGLVFASKNNKKYVSCDDSTGPHDDESIECWQKMDKPYDGYEEERFRVGALGSKFCIDLSKRLETTFSKKENPIDIDCTGKSCICYNVAHCPSAHIDDGCNDGSVLEREDANDKKVLTPPSNGSGAGGSWP